jgi:putative DNA primase/helicase
MRPAAQLRHARGPDGGDPVSRHVNTAGYSFDEISVALAAQADRLGTELLGKPTLRGQREWRWGRKGGIKLTRTARFRGWFYDHAEGRPYPPISMIARERGLSRNEAARWAALEFLGWPDISAKVWTEQELLEREKVRAAAEHEQKRLREEWEAFQRQEQQRRIDEAFAKWRRGVPVKGTPAETYLNSRGIHAEAWPDAVRWHPAKRWLMAASTCPVGEVTAVQMIHLDDAGEPVKREDGSKIKLTNGVLRGGAVRFVGNTAGPMVICEGIETALSVWWVTGFETWVALGIISNVDISPADKARTIVACPDDDGRGAVTTKAARKAISKWRRQGRDVRIATPFDHLQRDKADFNDALKLYGREYVAGRIAKVLDPEKAAERPGTHINEARDELGVVIEGAMGKLVTEAIAGIKDHSQLGIRVSVGGGKTHVAIASMLRAVDRLRREMPADPRSIVYAVPTHRLGKELEARIGAESKRQKVPVVVKTWRGRGADDPDSPTGAKMCTNLGMVEAAQKAGLEPQTAVCKSDEALCPLYATCAFQRQKDASADVWIVPHASLFHRKDAALGDVGLLIVDESIWQSSLRGFEARRVTVGMGSLKAHPKVVNKRGETSLFKTNDLIAYRRRLLDSLEKLDAVTGMPTYLPVPLLMEEGLTAKDCKAATGLELARKITGGLSPGMDREEFLRRAEELSGRQGDALSLSDMWRLLANAIETGEGDAGRVSFELIDKGQHEALVLRWVDDIKKGWLAPTLHIDATLRPELVRHLFPRFEMVADIHAATPHQRTVAVTGKSFSHQALSEEGKVLDIWDAVLLRARQVAGDTLVVMPLAAEKVIRAKVTIPDHIHILHHNGTAGLDSFGSVDLLICMGRTQPPPGTVSLMAGAIGGKAPAPIGTADGWYWSSIVTLVGRDGSAASVTQERHLDGLEESIRSAICDDQLVQAIGRGRAVNRTERNPLTVEIWGDHFPPVPVDSVALFQWPSKDERAIGHGVHLESAADLAKWLPELGSENAIKMDRRNRKPGTEVKIGDCLNLCRTVSNSSVIITRERHRPLNAVVETANPDPSQVETGGTFPVSNNLHIQPPDHQHIGEATYQRATPGAKPKRLVWDERAIPDIKGAVDMKIGPVSRLEVTKAPLLYANGKPVLMCESYDEVPLTLANGRTLAIAPHELENCITHPDQHLEPGCLLLRREGSHVTVFEGDDAGGGGGTRKPCLPLAGMFRAALAAELAAPAPTAAPQGAATPQEPPQEAA